MGNVRAYWRMVYTIPACVKAESESQINSTLYMSNPVRTSTAQSRSGEKFTFEQGWEVLSRFMIRIKATGTRATFGKLPP